MEIHLCRLEPVEIHHDEPRRVPKLVHEIASHFKSFTDNRCLRIFFIFVRFGPLSRELLAAFIASNCRLLSILFCLID